MFHFNRQWGLDCCVPPSLFNKFCFGGLVGLQAPTPMDRERKRCYQSAACYHSKHTEASDGGLRQWLREKERERKTET